MNILKIINFTKNSFSIKKIRRISFRNDINGLRALAVVGVVLYHLDFKYFGGSIFYYDTNHLTKTGAELVGEKIVAVLNEQNKS